MSEVNSSQLAELVAHFELSQHYSRSGTWRLNLKTNDLYWSSGVFELLGLKPDEVVPSYETFQQAIYPEDLPKTEAAIQACLEEGKPYDVIHRVNHKDGSTRWVKERGDIVNDDHGEPLYLLGTGYDVSHEIALEKERENLIAKLEKAVNEIKTLRGIIPICSYCHQIRNEKGVWDALEDYISKHTEAQFSHGLCPPCSDKVKADYFKAD